LFYNRGNAIGQQAVAQFTQVFQGHHTKLFDELIYLRNWGRFYFLSKRWCSRGAKYIL